MSSPIITQSGINASLRLRIPLFLILAIFVACKIPHLFYPFYWDESWSYAPALQLMYEHGPSLMPDAIDSFYSRGHPLLFYASAASWMRIFGNSHVSMHSFSLFVSVCLLIAIYEAGLRIFSQKVAALAVLLMGLQVIFFVQSAFLLPEIMLALFTFLTIWFYSARRYCYTFLSLTALVLTKESGMVMGLVLGGFSLVPLFCRQLSLKERIAPLLSVTGAGVVIGVFFILQKKMLGWYFYPLHTGLIENDWNKFYYKLIASFEVIFSKGDCEYNYFLLIALGLVAAVRYKKWQLAGSVLFLVTGYCISVMGWRKIENIIPVMAVGLSLMFFMIAIIKDDSFNDLQKRFLVIAIAFFFCYLLFACVNFFTGRYLLCIMVLSVFVSSIMFVYYATLLHRFIYPVVIIAVISFCGTYFYTNTDFGDGDIESFNAMRVQQAIVDYLEDCDAYDNTIGAGPYQEIQHLQVPMTGFLRSKKYFKNVTWEIEGNTDYAIFNNIEEDYRYKDISSSSDFRLVYRIEKGKVWGEVYKRNRK